MPQIHPVGRLTTPAGHMLGRKLDSIPFSRYHMMLIAVLALVGFVDGYDLVMTGYLLVLAKQPLHLAPSELRFLTIASTMMIVVGGFIASAISDHYSRKTVMLIGVAGITLFTLLLALVQTGEQLIIVRLLTGLAGGFAVFAPFPIAAELMPARHRRTFAAVYEMALACSFALLPFVAFLLADNPNAFRHAGADLLPAPGEPALVFAQRPRRGGGRNRQPDHRPGRKSGSTAGAGSARRQCADGARRAAAVSGVVPSRPAAVDGNRNFQLYRLRYRLFSDLGAAAEGSGRPGRRGHVELWRKHAGLHREHTG
jgi:Major Facilitator Superfamily